jgi:2-oxoisovalerate dehydrogenase E1 component
MAPSELKLVIQSGILTFLVHCQARIASSNGQGYYTISPCGEELLCALTLHLRNDDMSALHYRHAANSICRQLKDGRSIERIALDRARAYVCSINDPISGGKHCLLGGSRNDFIVTSTLASQAPAAVGRALGLSLVNLLKTINIEHPAKQAISYVSVGDGSVNNAHFLSAMNLSKYASHRGMKVHCFSVKTFLSDHNVLMVITVPYYLRSF